MPIDDPIDQIRQVIDEPDHDLLGGLIHISAVFEPVMAVIAAVKAVIDTHERYERVRVALRALCNELECMRESLPVDAAAALNSEWFRKAVQVMIEETARSVSNDRAIHIAVALAHGCFPRQEDSRRQEDLANYIRDLAQLGTDDVQMLKVLRDCYGGGSPNMPDPNYFTERFDEFKRIANNLNIHPDDRIALGARLAGFGLAYETVRNTSRQTPAEHCFRPTRRGLYLLSLLEAAGSKKDSQN